MCNLPFIWCASHRFKLAVNDSLENYDYVLAAIHSLIGKLKGRSFSERLRKVTPLVPQTKNATRWSPSYHMLERWFLLKDFLPHLDFAAVDELFLSPSKRQENDLVTSMHNPEPVTQ